MVAYSKGTLKSKMFVHSSQQICHGLSNKLNVAKLYKDPSKGST